jgi:hypothetical protein
MKQMIRGVAGGNSAVNVFFFLSQELPSFALPMFFFFFEMKFCTAYVDQAELQPVRAEKDGTKWTVHPSSPLISTLSDHTHVL